MGTVHALNAEQQQEIELTARFRKWWTKQDEMTKDAIREIVNGVDKSAAKADAVAVLEFLNLKTGRRFRPTEPNLKLIRARLRTATISECKAVVVIKCREWMGTEMEHCLRPATLFNATKFEQYIAEVGE